MGNVTDKTILSLQQYGVRGEVTLDHSDTTIDEVMKAFEGLLIIQGYPAGALEDWAREYLEEREDLPE